MSFIQQKISSVKKRLQFLSFGIIYFLSKNFIFPKRLWVNGMMRELIFNNADGSAFKYEFNEICINDCYGLHLLKKKLDNVLTIVDIGANQGLFLVAARKAFSKALIFGYEPNRKIETVLSFNAKALNATIFFEAVTRMEGKVDLFFGETDLHTVAKTSSEGITPATAFRKVIDNAGGQIDILKMDCEGGEWDIFEDTDSWRYVNSLTMEYHLWAKDGSTQKDIVNIIEGLGFHIITLTAISDKFGLLTAIKK
jgi:FkbM family methyltransferase